MRWTAALLALVAAGTASSSTAAGLRQHPPTWNVAGHGGFALGFRSIWIAGSDAVLRIDPRTNRIKATIPGGGSWPIATADGVWVISGELLERIDPSSDRIAVRIPLPAGGSSMAYGFGGFWITTQDGTLLRVDPAARVVVARIAIQSFAGWSPMVAVGAGAVWVASGDRHQVVRVDPATNSVTQRIPVGHDDSLLTVAVAYGSVWAHANAGAGGRGLLYRIDSDTGKVLSSLRTSTAPTGEFGGTNIASGASSLWVSNANGTVARISSDGARVVAARTTSPGANFVAVALGSLWVQGYQGPAVRIPLARW